MPISSTQRKFGPTPGNGVAKDFPFTCKVFETSDIQVIRTSANGGDTFMSPGSDFTVTLNADQNEQPGGTVTLAVALPTGQFVTLLSAVPLTQPTDWQNQGGFAPDTMDDSLDRGVAQTQQLAEGLSRAIQAPVTSAPIQVAKPVGNRLLAWSEDGTTIINIDPSDLIGFAAYGETVTDTFTGDGIETVFVLSFSAGAESNLLVAMGGVVQTPGVDYTWPGGAQIEFTTAPGDGIAFFVRYQRALEDSGGQMMTDGSNAAPAFPEVVGVARDNLSNVDPVEGRAALGVSPAPFLIVDGLIYDDPAAAVANYAKLEQARSSIPDGVVADIVIPEAVGDLHLITSVLNNPDKPLNWRVPQGVTLVGGDLYVDNKQFWDGDVPFEITTNRTGVGAYQATYHVRNHEDASVGPGSGERFYYKKSGLSTAGFSIARTTLADFRNLNGGVGLNDWRLTVCQPKSSPGDTRTFFVYDSEINVVNLWADQGYERNIYAMPNPVGGVFFVPEAQDFVEGRGGGYNVQFAFMLGHSGGNSPATGEKMKTYIGYGASPNAIAPGGGLLVASGNDGDTGNGGGTSAKDPGFAGQFWDTWDTGWDFSNATFRSGIYEKLPAGAKTKYGTGDFVSISGGVRTFQSGATLYRETLTAGHMVVSTDGVPLNFEVSGFFNCIGALGGGLRIDGVQVVGPVMPYIAPASGAVGVTPTKAEFDALVTSYNILLYYLRRGTGHGLLMNAP